MKGNAFIKSMQRQPVVAVLSIVTGAGLCLMLMMQKAKNAAILRTLGLTKHRGRGHSGNDYHRTCCKCGNRKKTTCPNSI